MAVVGSSFLTALFTLSLLRGGHTRITVGSLPTLAHRLRGNLHIDSASQLVITEFGYDGLGPDTFVYYYRPGATVSDRGGGVIVPLSPPQGEGSEGKFTGSSYNGNGVLTINLPSGTTVCDIATFTIWCRAATQFFTKIQIPSSVFLNGVRATSGECLLTGDSEPPTLPPDTVVYGNCEILSPSLQLQWNVMGSAVQYKICGCRPINRQNQYMGFGLSAESNRTYMINADATIAWADIMDGSPSAQDYYLTARSPCVAGAGVCPDTMVTGRTCTDDVYNVSGGMDNMQQCVKFYKGLTASDECDLSVADNDTEQYIVWAVGGLGNTAFVHFTRSNVSTPPLSLLRLPVDNCRDTSLSCESCPAFESKRMVYEEDTTFRLTIGPAGGQRGYPAITSLTGWGISWYVNGTLIPELVLKRGSTYTFVVEGGSDGSNSANYHPFYITSSELGGRLNHINQGEVVYAGMDDNSLTVGRLCQWSETEEAARVRTTCGVLEDYQEALTMACGDGASGELVWTPDERTPDVVYYQCATHRNLGWKITFSSAPTSAITFSSAPTSAAVSLSTVLVLILAALCLTA